MKMGELKAGDSFRDFTGPLGCASEFVHEDLESLKNKKMLFVAGGVGAAPVYPQVKCMIGFMLTIVGISSFFVKRQTNFIMIIGPIATHTSYCLP